MVGFSLVAGSQKMLNVALKKNELKKSFHLLFLKVAQETKFVL